MLKSLEIWNFESHEHTIVHFGTNFNLIIGPSNSGKSSIIRAASVVTANKWSKEQVRNGYEYCRIKITTDRGWVECERGEKANRWKVYDGNDVQEYKNVGTGVPDTVPQVLGMCEQDRGEVKEMPNFMFQLDKHYMLAEIDGKKATSNLVARMMDNAIGLGGMEDLIKSVSTDLLKDKKWLTEKQSEIVNLKSEIIDDIIFDDYKKLVEKTKKAFEDTNALNNDIEHAEKLYNEYQELYIKRQKYNEIVFPDTDLMTDLCNNIKKIITQINLYQTLNDLQNSKQKYKILNNIDIQKMFEMIQDIKILAQRVQDAENELNSARKLWKDKDFAQKELQQNTEKLSILQKDLKEIKHKLGVCPLCGAKFKDE